MDDTGKHITGVVLLNLGGPDSLQAVRPFLFNLFSDREIIRLGPSFLQRPIAWLISTLRSKKAEEMYRQIGGRSPILDITRAQAEALERALNQNTEHRTQSTDERSAPVFKVYIGMRYWHPFTEDMVKNIVADGVKDLIVLTMYPHYSKATTGSSVDEFKRALSKFQISNFKFQYIDRWYDFPPYIDALAEIISQGLSEFSPSCNKGGQGGITILYSAHSLPQSFIDEGDPYLEHIKITIDKVNQRLSEGTYNIKNLKWRLSFQSKTGPVKWLEPSTDEAIIKLANEGCKNLFVVPISFVSDHIETLYEIDILYKNLAEKHGMILNRCRALNTSEKFIHAMRELVMEKVQGAAL